MIRLSLLILAVLIAGARAQVPQSPAAPSLTDLIQALESPEPQARMDATDAILQTPAITLKQIEAALRTEKLSPEQRQRLLGVAWRRFRTEPRAAMGIRNDGNLGSHGVSLAFLQPGFPASQVLKIGDRVIAAAGVTIDTWETMRAVIISRDPGDEIPITVVREGATLNLTVGLGDFTRLREPINLDALILNEAWRMRSRGLDDPEPVKAGIIASGLPASAWSTQYGLLADEAAELGLTTSRNGPDPGIALVPGGEPRGGLQGAVQPPIMQRGAFNARGGANRLPGQPLVAPQDAAALVQQQQLLAQQQKFWVLKSLETDRQAQLDALNQQMADPAMDPQARQAVKMRIEGVTQSLKSIREDLARVDALVNPKGNVH